LKCRRVPRARKIAHGVSSYRFSYGQQNKNNKPKGLIMEFTSEHHQIRETTRKFVENEINPYIVEWEKEGRFPAHELFKKLGNLGLLGIHKPVEYGGMGLDYSYNLVAVEEFGRAIGAGVPTAIGVQTDMATPALARFGSDQLKREFLAPAIAGDLVASIAVTEPHAGSDVANIKTTAKKDGNDYIINGSKTFITNGNQCDFFTVLCNTSDDHPHKNKSLIIVPANLPGVDRSTSLKKMGLLCSDTATVFFDNVRVPQSYLIGSEGAGFIMQMQQFQEERLYCAAGTYPNLEKIIEETISYTQERKAFGKPIIANQVVQHKLVEMMTEVASLKALTHEACAAYVRGEDVTVLASMAKLKTGKLVRSVPSDCLQFWGGAGYMDDNIVARSFRDTRVVAIGGGADEIMCGIIAKLKNLNPK